MKQGAQRAKDNRELQNNLCKIRPRIILSFPP